MSPADTWLRNYTAARVSPEKLAHLGRVLANPRMSVDQFVLIACTIHVDADGRFTATDAEITGRCNEISEAGLMEYQP